jgi:hypothetical protein
MTFPMALDMSGIECINDDLGMVLMSKSAHERWFEQLQYLVDGALKYF